MKLDQLQNATSIEEDALGSLRFWLKYEKHTWLLGGTIVWLPYGLVIMTMVAAAVIFTPYMLWQLGRAGWHKSIAVFAVAVLLPITFRFIGTGNMIADFLLAALPLFNFYSYTWMLSHMVDEYLAELETVKQWERQDGCWVINE